MGIPVVAKTQDLRVMFACVEDKSPPPLWCGFNYLLPTRLLPPQEKARRLNSFFSCYAYVTELWSQYLLYLFNWNLNFKLLWLWSQSSFPLGQGPLFSLFWDLCLQMIFSHCGAGVLFPSITHQLATFWNHGFGNQMCYSNWLWGSLEPFHIFY